MQRKKLIVSLFIAGLVVASFAIAEPSKDARPGQPEMKLPPGWTPEDMQACAAAAAPGKQHGMLAKAAGTWEGKATMTMPGMEPSTSPCTVTAKSILDGRFLHIDHKGEMPGMGPFTGHGLYGFDNVTQKFQCAWIDNGSTAIWTGTGELSPDEKSITWTYSGPCPITKKPTMVREVDTMTSDTTKTMELYSTDPKTGKEFKMMSVEFTKK